MGGLGEGYRGGKGEGKEVEKTDRERGNVVVDGGGLEWRDDRMRVESRI